MIARSPTEKWIDLFSAGLAVGLSLLCVAVFAGTGYGGAVALEIADLNEAASRVLRYIFYGGMTLAGGCFLAMAATVLLQCHLWTRADLRSRSLPVATGDSVPSHAERV